MIDKERLKEYDQKYRRKYKKTYGVVMGYIFRLNNNRRYRKNKKLFKKLALKKDKWLRFSGASKHIQDKHFGVECLSQEGEKRVDLDLLYHCMWYWESEGLISVKEPESWKWEPSTEIKDGQAFFIPPKWTKRNDHYCISVKQENYDSKVLRRNMLMLFTFIVGFCSIASILEPSKRLEYFYKFWDFIYVFLNKIYLYFM